MSEDCRCEIPSCSRYGGGPINIRYAQAALEKSFRHPVTLTIHSVSTHYSRGSALQTTFDHVCIDGERPDHDDKRCVSRVVAFITTEPAITIIVTPCTLLPTSSSGCCLILLVSSRSIGGLLCFDFFHLPPFERPALHWKIQVSHTTHSLLAHYWVEAIPSEFMKTAELNHTNAPTLSNDGDHLELPQVPAHYQFDTIRYIYSVVILGSPFEHQIPSTASHIVARVATSCRMVGSQSKEMEHRGDI